MCVYKTPGGKPDHCLTIHFPLMRKEQTSLYPFLAPHSLLFVCFTHSLFECLSAFSLFLMPPAFRCPSASSINASRPPSFCFMVLFFPLWIDAGLCLLSAACNVYVCKSVHVLSVYVYSLVLEGGTSYFLHKHLSGMQQLSSQGFWLLLLLLQQFCHINGTHQKLLKCLGTLVQGPMSCPS